MEKKPKPSKKKEKREKKEPISAMDRCRAVLSVWSQSRKPSEICRELEIKWTVLQNWEDRALQGMLRVLAPRKKQERGPWLSPRLVKLLKKQEVQEEALESRLEKRLVKIQESRSGKEAPAPSSVVEKKKG